MEEVTIAKPDTTKVRSEVDDLRGAAQMLKVTDAATAQAAADFVRDLKGQAKKVEEFFKPSIEAAHATHRLLCDQRREILAPLEAIEREVRTKIDNWAAEERRQREAEARRIREEERKAEEARQLAEAEAREAEGSKPLDLEEAAAEAEFRADLAEERALQAAAPPKVAGVAVRETWSAKVTDLPALLRYAADNEAARPYVAPNQKLLDSLARQLKDDLKVPGVRAVKETKTAIRG